MMIPFWYLIVSVVFVSAIGYLSGVQSGKGIGRRQEAAKHAVRLHEPDAPIDPDATEDHIVTAKATTGRRRARVSDAHFSVRRSSWTDES